MALTAEEAKSWLDNNADKAGMPDYVTVAEAYNNLSATTPSVPSVGSTDEAAITGIPSVPKLGAIRAADSPNSFANIAQRNIINRITAIPDIGVALANIGSRYGIFPETKLPYVGSIINRALGGQDMPAEAPLWQRAAEGLATGLNPSNLVRSAKTSAASIAGAEGGAALGQATGIDPELLSIVGGLGGGTARTTVPNAARAGIATLYRGSGRPNAGEVYDAGVRTGTTPTGAMLGNQGVQRLEQVLERSPGSGPTIVAAREQARNQFTDAARAVPEAAGATMRNPTEIGQFAQNTARTSLDMLEQTNRLRQQQMQDQIGSRTPVNVAEVDRTMSRLVDPETSDLSVGSFPPIQSKLDELRANYPQPAGGAEGPPAPLVRQAPFVDWRNNLLTKREDMPPISANAASPITGDARQAYLNTAIQQGVPLDRFNATQMRSRMLNDPGGQRETLGPLAPPMMPQQAPLPPRENPAGTSDLATVFNRIPGLTDPQGMESFRASVNAGQGVTAGDPQVSNIFASRINDLLDRTLLRRGEYAPGPTDFYETIQKKTDPAALVQSVGPQGAATLNDVATLAQAFHRPTVSGGGTRSIMDVVNNTRRALTPLAAGGISLLLGHDPGTAAGIAGGATAISEAANRFGPIDRTRAAMLNSPTAGAAMAGRPIPYTGIDINDIRTTLNALQGSTPRGPLQAQ